MTIDRTQWELGKSKINFLVVAVPYKRMAIPLFWMLLSKKGNSNYKERVELLKCLFEFIPKERIKGVIGDREFIGKHWFHWLIERNIPFYMRIVAYQWRINGNGHPNQSLLRYFCLQRKVGNRNSVPEFKVSWF